MTQKQLPPAIKTPPAIDAEPNHITRNVVQSRIDEIKPGAKLRSGPVVDESSNVDARLT